MAEVRDRHLRQAHNAVTGPPDQETRFTEQLAHALCDHECDPGWWEKTDEEEREHYRRTIRALLSSGPLADRLAQADQDAAALARVRTVPAKLEAQKGSVQGNVARLLAAQRIRTALRDDR